MTGLDRGILGGTAGEHVAAMSTVDLYANLRLAQDGGGDFQGIVPTARLLGRMESEWMGRPLQDRLAAQARVETLIQSGQRE